MDIKVNISTPCIGVCQYNEEEFCRGCFRTFSEITEWANMSEDERLEVMKTLDERAQSIF
jgi:predicted Fe-S protein YdhL (DUF1289 family)|tara:strand:- start:639 stop:818 length:180 start_codon:yes stop_codon:yes gene_type:complete